MPSLRKTTADNGYGNDSGRRARHTRTRGGGRAVKGWQPLLEYLQTAELRLFSVVRLLPDTHNLGFRGCTARMWVGTCLSFLCRVPEHSILSRTRTRRFVFDVYSSVERRSVGGIICTLTVLGRDWHTRVHLYQRGTKALHMKHGTWREMFRINSINAP